MVANVPVEREQLFHRRIQMDPKRHRFHNKAALMLSVATCVLLMTLSLIFGHEQTNAANNRYLYGNDDDNDDDSSDFSSYSCRYIYDKVPDAGYKQCQFSRTCNGGEGVWAPWVFCKYNSASVRTLFVLLSPIMLLWLITLFRMLGSTAEDYFSPSLEMFSVKLGLPPRFAGVSLLALGNGAADVSATMSAIVNDEEFGYKLSLGALTGAAMLVGGVVAGMVVLVAGGVPCRGALVRDVTALCITIVVVWHSLSNGEIGGASTSLFLSMYALFVCLVLVADVYHRAVVLPRLAAAQADDSELQHQRTTAEHQVHQQVGAAVEIDANNDDVNANINANANASRPPSALARMITAFSNYDNPCNQDTTTTAATAATSDIAGEGWGVSSTQLQNDGPIVLHGQHGILHGDGGNAMAPNMNMTATATDAQTEDWDGGGAYALVEDHIDQICAGEGSRGTGSTNWSGAWHDGKQELVAHVNQVWEDVCYNGDLNGGEKFLMFCELPFTFARKATVPIPCEGYYNRGVVTLAIALSPLWFAYYIYSGHGINLLAKDSIFYFLSFELLAIVIAAAVLRYAPGGDGHMPMGIATPIALYGFIIAATWIDFVADHLVKLLDFMGIVLHIPGTIMGLTILAWGNSMGDLSANMTMARKGLANMAMTACFAGPIFNILIGLGLGFSSLAAKTGNPYAKVELSPPVITGFVFVLLNCATILIIGIFLGKGRIESYFGYVALVLYVIYLVTSITLQFSKYGDD